MKLAEKKGFAKRLEAISLGQGQGKHDDHQHFSNNILDNIVVFSWQLQFFSFFLTTLLFFPDNIVVFS